MEKRTKTRKTVAQRVTSGTGKRGKTSKHVKKKSAKKHTARRKQLHISIWSIAVILAITLVCVFWPYIRSRSKPETGAMVPPGAYSFGIDISHYQTKIIWDSLRVMTDARRQTTSSKIHARDIKPISFVIIKATEGAGMKDKRFHKHWDEAANHGIRRGAYHFFRSSKDPMQQARLFINTAGEISQNDLPPILDIETIHKGCSRKTLNDKAIIWLKAVENHYGRKPMVYSSSSFIIDLLNDEIKLNYPIWVAHYGVEYPRYKNWHIWQFTDKGLVYGIDGFVDLNVCRQETLDIL